jgi:hypothetical protein
MVFGCFCRSYRTVWEQVALASQRSRSATIGSGHVTTAAHNLAALAQSGGFLWLHVLVCATACSLQLRLRVPFADCPPPSVSRPADFLSCCPAVTLGPE